jgi:hypothetical protein
MNALVQPTREQVCAVCGIPLDAQYFDSSAIVDVGGSNALEPGRAVPLVSVELPPQYCGVLQYFFQFTNTHAQNPSRIETPGFEWSIRINGHPLNPYLALRHIINPWGSAIAPISIRLDEGARLEFIVRPLATADPGLRKIGARLAGRYWYNTAYGNGP